MSRTANPSSSRDSPHVRVLTLNAADRANAPQLEEKGDEVKGSSLLSSFLHPLTLEEFRCDIWKKKALHIRYNNDTNGDTKGKEEKHQAKGRKKNSTGAAVTESAADVDRFSYLKRTYLSNLNVSGMLEETASDNIFVWMRSKDSNTSIASAESIKAAKAAAAAGGAKSNPNATALFSFELDASNPAHLTAAEHLYSSGASLYFRSPPNMVEEFVGGFANGCGFNFTSSYNDGTQKGEIEVFLSRTGHLTDWHTDFMENFTFQLAGTKTWHLKKSNVAHPLRGSTPHYRNIDTEEQQLKVHSLTDAGFTWESRPTTRTPHTAEPQSPSEDYDSVTLGPGDCFYHPAGIWHRVECDDDSISINVSLISQDWSSFVADGMRHRMWKDDSFRAGIDVRDMTDAHQQLNERLTKLRAAVATMKAEDLLPQAIFLPRREHYNLRRQEDDATWDNMCAGATAIKANDKQNGKKGKSAGVASSPSPASSTPSSFVYPDPISSRRFSSSQRFRVNPLCVLLKYDHRKKANAEREKERIKKEARGSPANEEDEEEEDDNDDEDGSDSDSDSVWSDCPTKVGYVLHWSFGNESLDSSVRVTLDLHPDLEEAMDTIRQAIMFDKVESFNIDTLSKQNESHTTIDLNEPDTHTAPNTAGTSLKRKGQKVQQPTDAKRRKVDADASHAKTSALRQIIFFLAQQGAIQMI